MFRLKGVLVEKCIYAELYKNNETGQNSIYIECLTRDNEDSNVSRNAIIRIEDFNLTEKLEKYTLKSRPDPNEIVEVQNSSNSDGSLKDQYENLTGTTYDETFECILIQKE